MLTWVVNTSLLTRRLCFLHYKILKICDLFTLITFFFLFIKHPIKHLIIKPFVRLGIVPLKNVR